MHELRPAILFARQLRLAGSRPTVLLRLLVGLAHPPLRLQPSVLHEAVQGGIERAGFNLEEIVGLPANGLANAMAVLGPPLEGAQNEHVESALEQFQASIVGSSHSPRQ